MHVDHRDHPSNLFAPQEQNVPEFTTVKSPEVLLDEADGLLLTAIRCAQKLRTSVTRGEMQRAAEYGWLVDQLDAMREWRRQARLNLEKREGKP